MHKDARLGFDHAEIANLSLRLWLVLGDAKRNAQASDAQEPKPADFLKVKHVRFPSTARPCAMGLFIRLSIGLVNRVSEGRANYFPCYSQAHQKRIKKRIIPASS